MSDIKLFGRTIHLPETFSAESGGESNKNGCFSRNPQTDESVEEQSLKERCYNMNKGFSQPFVQMGLKGANLATNPNGPFSFNNDVQAVQALKTDEQQEVGVLQDKSFKKPERILQCPRCNSVDTKFCYYNNYNTNQPRHFCKNCQRYWTAGGTMRNVPVGAGRRKSKSVVAPFLNAVPEALQKAGVSHSNSAALKFSSDAPLCESMVSSLSIGDKKSLSNGFSQTGEQESCVSLGSKECHSSESSVANPKNVIGKMNLHEQVPNGHPFPSQVQCFPGAPWPYPCHSVQWSSAPTFAYASFHMPSSYSTAPQFVGCTVPSLWTGPWIIPPASMALCSGASSPTLGKHSRDKSANSGEKSPKERTSEPILWVPKTSRIDDTSELTKSSIMSKLGIKDGADSVGTNLFKPFKDQSKNKGTLEKNFSSVLQANPAALSRALTFHESS